MENPVDILSACCISDDNNVSFRRLLAFARSVSDEERAAILRNIPAVVRADLIAPIFLDGTESDEEMRRVVDMYSDAYYIHRSAYRFGQSSLYLPGYMSASEARVLFDEIRQGSGVEYIPPSHPAMLYRGNKLARTKILLTTGADALLATPEEQKMAEEVGCLPRVRRYVYTGSTYQSLELYRTIESMPRIAQLAQKISSDFGFNVNHVIVTSYGHDDYIGAHDDKPRSLSAGKPIVVITLGEAERQFVVTAKDGGREVARITTESGSCLTMSYSDNSTHKHAVVPVKEEVGSTRRGRRSLERVSIVFREITEISSVLQFHKRSLCQLAASDARAKERAYHYLVGRVVHHDNGPCEPPQTRLRIANARSCRFCLDCFPCKRTKKLERIVDTDAPAR